MWLVVFVLGIGLPDDRWERSESTPDDDDPNGLSLSSFSRKDQCLLKKVNEESPVMPECSPHLLGRRC